MLSRRQLLGAAAGGASLVALAACGTIVNSDGSLTSTALSFLKTASGVLSSAAAGLAGVEAGFSALTNIQIPASVTADFSGGISALGTIASNLLTAATSTSASDLFIKAGSYLSAVLSAGAKILAIPGVSALPFAGEIETALAVASVLVPFLANAASYIAGVITNPPSTTATVTATTTTTTASGRRFGALPPKVNSVATAAAYLQSLAKPL